MARRSNSKLEIDMKPLITGVTQLDNKIDRAVAGVVLNRSHQAVGWMKSNARWRDRTGAARAGLRTETSHVPKKSHTIHLMHSVAYGIWLEVRWAGRYAIIEPAIRDQGKKLMVTLNKLMARL